MVFLFSCLISMVAKRDSLSNLSIGRSYVSAVIYLDWRLFGAAGWCLSALAVDPVILQPAWRL